MRIEALKAGKSAGPDDCAVYRLLATKECKRVKITMFKYVSEEKIATAVSAYRESN